MSHTEMKRTTMKTPGAAAYHELPFTAWKLCFKTDMKTLPWTPKGALLFPCRTQWPKHCCAHMLGPLSLESSWRPSLEEGSLSYRHGWPKGLGDHLRERGLCDWVITVSPTTATRASAFSRERGRVKRAQHTEETAMNILRKHSKWCPRPLSPLLLSTLLFRAFLIKGKKASMQSKQIYD